MTVNLSSVQLVVGVVAVVVIAMIRRASARRAKHTGRAAGKGVRLAGLTARVLITAAVFWAVQWIVLTHPGHSVLTAVVVGLPDLSAGYVLARALTVSTVDGPRHGRGARYDRR